MIDYDRAFDVETCFPKMAFTVEKNTLLTAIVCHATISFDVTIYYRSEIVCQDYSVNCHSSEPNPLASITRPNSASPEIGAVYSPC